MTRVIERAVADLCIAANDWARWIESKGGEPSSGCGAALLQAARAWREACGSASVCTERHVCRPPIDGEMTPRTGMTWVCPECRTAWRWLGAWVLRDKGDPRPSEPLPELIEEWERQYLWAIDKLRWALGVVRTWDMLNPATGTPEPLSDGPFFRNMIDDVMSKTVPKHEQRTNEAQKCERCGGAGVYLVENHGPQEVECECQRLDEASSRPKWCGHCRYEAESKGIYFCQAHGQRAETAVTDELVALRRVAKATKEALPFFEKYLAGKRLAAMRDAVSNLAMVTGSKDT